jgi:calcineurin-like phosphoesterase family protein
MRKFKFAHRDDVMFTADTHFGHGNIIKHCNRPYADAGEMDEALIRNWNRVVAAGQTVFHLGDFSFKTSDRRVTSIIERLNGHIVLIRGNHDHEQVLKHFGEVHDLAEVLVPGHRIVLCHYAMRVWPRSHRDSWHLYGHSHGRLAPVIDSMALDVGVDAWDYTPVRFDQIAREMQRLSL